MSDPRQTSGIRKAMDGVSGAFGGLLAILFFLAPFAGPAAAQSSTSYRLSGALVQGASTSSASGSVVVGCLDVGLAGKSASTSWVVESGCSWGAGLYHGLPNVNGVSGGGTQGTQVNQPFALALQVTVTDPFGDPVAGATVVFTAPASGASCTFGGGGSATTDATGVASVAATANASIGSYVVTASVSGLAQVTFSLANNPLPVELQSFSVD